MALIKCPFCGKDVTDQNDVCIHCGHKLEGIKKAFEHLDKVKQESLLQDFLASHPQMDYGEASLRQVSLLGWPMLLTVFLFGGELLLVLAMRILPKQVNLFLYIAAIVFSVVSCLASCILYRKASSKTMHNILLAEKVFQLWLDKEKNIIYVPQFKNQQFQIQFDAIKIEEKDSDGNCEMS